MKEEAAVTGAAAVAAHRGPEQVIELRKSLVTLQFLGGGGGGGRA